MIPIYISSIQPQQGRSLCATRDDWAAIGTELQKQGAKGRGLAVRILRELKKPHQTTLIPLVFDRDDAQYILQRAGLMG